MDTMGGRDRRTMTTWESREVSGTMSVSIRRAIPEDATALARMRWDDSTDHGPSAESIALFAEDFAEFVRSSLASDQWAIWVAECDGQVVAHIYVQLVKKVPRPGRFAASWAYATAVYTVPGARNKGIGSRLLRRVIDWARYQELELLLLWPSDRSVAFYERAGFVRSPEALELHLDS
jgi:GNAT superfamily N-acetyltransferase